MKMGKATLIEKQILHKLITVIFITSIFLLGCSTSTNEKSEKEEFGLEKVQKVEVSSAKEPKIIIFVFQYSSIRRISEEMRHFWFKVHFSIKVVIFS
jgi:thioredoxin-related protein